MTDNKQLIRATYTNEAYGDIRTIYNLETDEVLFCARDVAKAFGYADPSRSVRDICINLIKEAHITDGGLQVLNFIGRHDVIRLFKHSRSENCYECLFFIDAVADDFAEKVFDKYIDGGGNDFDDDDPFECFGDCENCPYYDECEADEEYEDEYDDDETSPEFYDFLREHSPDIEKVNPFSKLVAEFVMNVTNLLNEDVASIDSLVLFKNGKPIYVAVKEDQANA